MILSSLTMIVLIIVLKLGKGIKERVQYWFSSYDMEDDFVHIKLIAPHNTPSSALPTETLLSNIHGLIDQLDFYVGLQIIGAYNDLSLVITTPKRYQRQIVENLRASYPNINVKIFPGNTNLFSNKPENELVFFRGELENDFVIPLTSFRQFMEFDPLQSFTSALQYLGEGEYAVIQFLLFPNRDKFQDRSRLIEKMIYRRVPRIYFKSKFLMGIYSLREKLNFGTPEKAEVQGEDDKQLIIAIEEKAKSHVFGCEIRVAVSADPSQAGQIGASIVSAFSQFNRSQNKIQFIGPNLVPAYKEGKSSLVELIYRNFHGLDLRLKRLENIGNSLSNNTDLIGGLGLYRGVFFDKGRDLNSVLFKLCLPSYEGYRDRNKNVLSTMELASMFHVQYSGDLQGVEKMHYKQLRPVKEIVDMWAMADENTKVKGGWLDSPGMDGKYFQLLDHQRRRHLYVIGKTGTGKSTVLKQIIIEDIQRGKGITLIDPHGDFANEITDFIPKERIANGDAIIIEPKNENFIYGINPFIFSKKFPLPASKKTESVLQPLKKIYGSFWGPRMENILRNVITTLVLYNEKTGNIVSMIDIYRILIDDEYRRQIVINIDDMYMQDFWFKEFDKYSPKDKMIFIQPILNKVGQFATVSALRKMFSKGSKVVSIEDVVDNQKILILNTANTGPVTSKLLGTLIVSMINTYMMSKESITEDERIDHYLFIDEFQNFITDEFEVILSEARKYKLNLSIAHQYTRQLIEAPKVLYSIKGNVGNMIIFGLGEDDPKEFIKGFEPELETHDIMNLPPFRGYAKISEPTIGVTKFSIKTIGPNEPAQKDRVVGLGKVAKEVSNKMYAIKGDLIEEEEKEIIERGNNITYKVREEDLISGDPIGFIAKQIGILPSTLRDWNQNRNIDFDNIKLGDSIIIPVNIMSEAEVEKENNKKRKKLEKKFKQEKDKGGVAVVSEFEYEQEDFFSPMLSDENKFDVLASDSDEDED